MCNLKTSTTFKDMAQNVVFLKDICRAKKSVTIQGIEGMQRPEATVVKRGIFL